MLTPEGRSARHVMPTLSCPGISLGETVTRTMSLHPPPARRRAARVLGLRAPRPKPGL